MMIFALSFLLTFSMNSSYGETEDPAGPGGAEHEVWELTLSGDVEAKCKMTLKQSKTLKDTYFVSGTFSGNMVDDTWGFGDMRCTLKGKTKKSVFMVKINGSTYMMDGDAAGLYYEISGKLRGTLSRTQGFGTWSLRIPHTYGVHRPDGEWTTVKIK